ncbi:MAG: chitobiase/beta-hexosaminidase C-terminal domain-containing protein [Terracidiphilus sp.]
MAASACTSTYAQTNEWTWMGGMENSGVYWGQYGILGTPGTGNLPGARQFAAGWTDKSGNLWLFGGSGYGASSSNLVGVLNDLWEFNPNTNEWVWMGGSNIAGTPGVYGTMGAPAVGNVPGARTGAASWTDSSGNFWLFGGYGNDSVAGAPGYDSPAGILNDLWKFSPSTNQWTWVSGSSTIPGCTGTYEGFANEDYITSGFPSGDYYYGCGQSGVYGTMGTAAATNVPGARYNADSWIDSKGNLWLFGGVGFDASGNFGIINDLWEFQTSTGEWMWVSGSNANLPTSVGQPGVYGTMQSPGQGNTPGGRESGAAWTDSKGNLWLFGGYGADSVGAMGYLNDLWQFNLSAKEWIWMGGSSTLGWLGGQSGSYETWMTPAAGNSPGGRLSGTEWTDSSGHFWLFGGYGYDSAGFYAFLNDLWEFSPTTNEWSWMDGPESGLDENTLGHFVANPGVYGTLQTPGFLNTPGGRNGATGWVDGKGNLWLFGGALYPTDYSYSYVDLWEYSLSTGSLPAAATPEFSPGGGTYPSGESVILTDSTPGSKIYYLTSGSASAAQYTEPLSVSSTETIQAVAVASGDAPSAVASATYTVEPTAAPTFSLAPGTYTTAETLVLSDATPNAVIYFTTDGSTPTTGSTVYTAPLMFFSTALFPAESATVQAIAVASGSAPSTVTAAHYTIWPASAGNEWAWVGGSNTGVENQVYGALGVPAAGNIPSPRALASTWTDKSGNFWLFGGGWDYDGLFNDLWKFSPSIGEWAWMGGDVSTNCGSGLGAQCGQTQPGVYGTLGTPAPENFPGGRQDVTSWVDSSGNFWLFGGFGSDANGTPGMTILNDLWKYDVATNQWAWMSGSNTASSCYNDGSGETAISGIVCAQAATYGSLGVPAAANTPGSRQGAIGWTDSKGNLWLFGGWSFDIPNQALYFFDELWEYNTTTNQWAWMGGSSTRAGSACNNDPYLFYFILCGEPGVYGTLGSPASGNLLGGRSGSATWTDRSGNVWLFGGFGFDAAGNLGSLQDVWEFNPISTRWTWMGGSNALVPCDADTSACSGPAVYGTLGVPAAGNIPVGRDHASTWTDANGNFWLFGGGSENWPEPENLVSDGGTNDLWEFNPSTNQWALMGASFQSICGFYCSSSPGAVYGTLGAPAPGNEPGARFGAASWTDISGNFWLFGGDGGGNDLWEYQPSTSALPTTATPTISLPSGTYTSGQSATISDVTDGAFIYYTTDGTTPTVNSTVFFTSGSQPINIQQSETLKAIAIAPGCLPSAVVSATYVLPPPATTPTLSLATGTYSTPQTVTISDSTPGATIYYQIYPGYPLNPVYPTTSSPVYTGPVTILSSETIIAMATAANYVQSGYVLVFYVINTSATQAAAPTFSVPAGTYAAAQTVTISDTTPGATIYYTTNGTTPTTGSSVYSNAIPVSASETIEAIAAASGYTNSAIASAVYTINLPPPTFTFSASPTSMTVYSGSQGSTTLAVTPQNGFNSAVSFACSGLPSGATCSFSPTTVTPSGTSAAMTQMTITVSAQAMTVRPRPGPFFPATAIAAAVCMFAFRRRRAVQFGLALAVIFAGMGLLSGCGGGGTGGGGGGGGGGSTPVTSTVTVTATSGSIQQIATLTLTTN